MLAGSSAIVAADQLSNDLYYSWVRFALYLVSLSMLSYGLVVYFRNRGLHLGRRKEGEEEGGQHNSGSFYSSNSDLHGLEFCHSGDCWDSNRPSLGGISVLELEPGPTNASYGNHSYQSHA